MDKETQHGNNMDILSPRDFFKKIGNGHVDLNVGNETRLVEDLLEECPYSNTQLLRILEIYKILDTGMWLVKHVLERPRLSDATQYVLDTDTGFLHRL